MARCLVVGGNGFLGSYVVDELVAAGHEVTVFDRFSDGSVSYTASGVRALAGDYLDSAQLRDALDGQQLLFHFLSTTTPVTADADPRLDIRTNVSQSVELFSLAVEAGIECVYFASTGGAIYGEQPMESIPETATALPVSPYAIGKQAIEGYLRYFASKHGLRSVTFRISNPYGPRQHPHKKQGVIPIFLHRVAHDEPVEVYGDTTMVRDYIFAPDAARMITATVERPTNHDVYNIGSGTGTSLAEIIDLTAAVTGSPLRIEHRERPATFVQRSVLDIDRYRAEFGDPTLVSLRDGIALTWQAVREASR